MLSDSEDEDVHKLTINEHYAKAFQYRKEREELDRLKAELGSDASSSDISSSETNSESAESEDEDGEELTPTVDAAILRTLARIRKKDPAIYESSKSIFQEEQEKIASKGPPTSTSTTNTKKPKLKETKPITIRQAALEAQLHSPSSSRSSSPEPSSHTNGLTHVEEQRKLRDEVISAFHTAVEPKRKTKNEDGDDDDEDDDDEDLLIPREKTQDERQAEEDEYRAFLEREVGDLREIVTIDPSDINHDDDIGEDGDEEGDIEGGEKDGEGKKKRKKKKKKKAEAPKRSKEEEDQEFLMSYILNRGWIDKSRDHIPTYSEITTTKPSSSKKSRRSKDETGEENDDGNLSTSSFDSLADIFEATYNHRFEEPNATIIPSFPRNIPTLARREDSKRKEARERRKQRKEEELERKREEVRRLKALKMREVKRKLEAIGVESGLLKKKDNMGKRKGGENDWELDDIDDLDGEEIDGVLRELDLEGDWDPETHDKQMAGLFADREDAEDEEFTREMEERVDENGKPIWEDDIDIGDNPMSDDDAIPVSNSSPSKETDKKKKKKKDNEEDGEIEDEGVDIDAMDADIIAKKRELGEDEGWDGTEEMRKRKLDEYMEDVYKLDFNDMVGDLPTRFKYVPVQSQSYSMTPVEILLATDKELNEFMSVKKYAPYRTDSRKWDATRQQKLKELKSKLVERSKNGGWITKDESSGSAGGFSGAVGVGEKVKKRKGKKERMRLKELEIGGKDAEAMEEVDENANTTKEGKKEKKRKQEQEKELQDGEDVHEDEDRKPKKKRRRKHKKGGEDA